MGNKTPLYEDHIAQGGRMVDFAGFMLPVQYEGIVAEHNAVRRSAGLFDVSHMTEFHIKGPDALSYLNRLCTNSFDNLSPGRVRYSPMCYEDGGTVDDLIIYRFCSNSFLVVGNACNHEKDYAHLCKMISGDVTLVDISKTTAQLALQGPCSAQVLQRLTTDELPTIYYSFKERVMVSGVHCLVSKTGYTGEDGYELYCRSVDVGRLFAAIAAEPEVTLCGLGCRDTLRFEASMPLYGHELSPDITPLECGLNFAVKLDKPDFIGRDALLKPSKRQRIGLKLTGRGIARGGEKVFANGSEVGFVTSGSHCPSLDGAYAMAIVDCDEQDYEIVIRGKSVAARRCNLPFYSKNN